MFFAIYYYLSLREKGKKKYIFRFLKIRVLDLMKLYFYCGIIIGND